MNKSVQWNKLNVLSIATYVSEQVCIGWNRTGAYYTDKLTFPKVLPSKFGVRIIQACVLYSNFYGRSKTTATITLHCGSTVDKITVE